MAIKLKIYKTKWSKKDRKEYVPSFPENFKHGKIKEKIFRSYVDMANWLDENKRYANKVMIAANPRAASLLKIRKVHFDGKIMCYVEGLGNI